MRLTNPGPGTVARLLVGFVAVFLFATAGAVFPLATAGAGAGASRLASPMPSNLAGGTIVGIVSTSAEAPRPIRATVDPEICGVTIPDESIARDAAGHIANAVITVAGVKSVAPAEAEVSNVKCAFVPRVALLRPNGAVKMVSRDPTIHTMHAADPRGRTLFNLSLPMPNFRTSRPITTPGVVALSCSTHTWMRGYLFVTDELGAISGSDGTFRIDGVPPGSHEVRVWHEALGAAPVTVAVKDGETQSIRFVLAPRAGSGRR